jgi:hypothetical protein
MTPWTFSIMIPYSSQLIFRSLMFTARDDESLELLTQGPAPRHPAPVFGQAPHLLANPSTSGGACSGLNPYLGSYHLSAMTSQGRPIGKTIFQPSTRAMGETHDRDSTEDYPKIGGSTCWNPVIKTHHINMGGPARGNSQNNSSKYQTIGGSKASNARTPSSNIVRNLNSDFNTVRLQTIMESIQ